MKQYMSIALFIGIVCGFIMAITSLTSLGILVYALKYSVWTHLPLMFNILVAFVASLAIQRFCSFSHHVCALHLQEQAGK